jgi:hypothetical protein
MSISNKAIETNNMDVTHEIYLLPTIYNKVGDLDIGKTGVSILFFMQIPLIEATKVKSTLSSRIQDLNPIGALYNERQDFGVHSKVWKIDGYITDLKTSITTTEKPDELGYSDVETTSSMDGFFSNGFKEWLNIPANRFRINMIKYCLYNSVPVFLMTNTDWDIITIDEFELTESDDEAYLFNVSLSGKSVLNRNSYGLKDAVSDTVVSTLITTLDIFF